MHRNRLIPGDIARVNVAVGTGNGNENGNCNGTGTGTGTGIGAKDGAPTSLIGNA